jgi:hypothetical protein
MALTERQQQIVGLQKQGKKAKEIGAALGITENAVYQQIRRIRERSEGGTPRTTRRQSAPKATAPAAITSPPANGNGTATPAAPAPKAFTPLQAIRARRDEITASVRELEAEVTQATKVLEKATVARDKAVEGNRVELAGLDAAEAALKGELSLPDAAISVAEAVVAATDTPEAPKGRSRGKGKGQAEREASQDDFDAADAEAAQAASEAPQGEPVPA